MKLTDFKKVVKVLREAYKEVEQEALKNGIALMSPEYDQLMAKTRELVVTKMGFDIEDYLKTKEKITSTSKTGMFGFMEKIEARLSTIESQYIPSREDISEIANMVANEVANEVANVVAKSYIKPPQIINQIVKETTVEKPQIIETIREIVTEKKYDDSPIKSELGRILQQLDEIKIPEQKTIEELREILQSDFSIFFEKNINTLGMPNFRKLAMGLQGQIDEIKNDLSAEIDIIGLTNPITANVLFSPDNTYDIGASGANRPKDIYAAGTIRATSLTATGIVTAGTGSIFTWSGRAYMASPLDGIITFLSNAGTDFSRLQFGGTTSAFPAIKRSSDGLHIRLADDSAFANLTALNGIFNSGVTFGNGSRISDAGDGVIRLLNNVGADFSRLQFGGTTAAFPALRRSGTGLQAVLADGSLFTSFRAATLFLNNGTNFSDSAGDGILTLLNAAGSGFTRLNLGGITSAFPSIKRNLTALDFRLADDSAYAGTNGGTSTVNATQSANLVINGTFAADTNWSKTGWTIGSGVASITGTGLGANNIQPLVALTVVAGKTYKVTFDATITAGTLTVQIGGASYQRTTSGTGIIYYLQAITTGNLAFSMGTSGTQTVSIDNVSVIEFTGGSLTVDQNITMNGGILRIPAGQNANPSLVIGDNDGYGITRINGNAAIAVIANGAIVAQFTSTVNASGFGIQNATNGNIGGLGMTTGVVSWGANTTMDVGFSRVSANVVGVGTGAAGNTAGTITGIFRLKGFTVATLPAGTQGDVCFVTDSLAPTFGATLVGGGAVVSVAFYNGTNWIAF